MMRSVRFALVLIVSALCLAALPVRAAEQSSEEKLLGILKSDAPAEQKCNACRELKTGGTEKSIPALAALLTDEEISHCARIALESMPYPAAGAALREAAGKAKGLTRSGILDSLGERRDAEAVPVLAPALEDSDVRVVAAAATALGKIGTADAAKALAAARAKAQGEARTKIGQGLVLCADGLLKAGNREEATKFYRELSQPEEPRTVRIGGLRGLVQAAAPQAAQVIAQMLAGDDPMVRAAAAEQMPRLATADLGTIAAGIAKLPASSQVSVLAALRIRGDKSFAPIALEAAKNGDPSVRMAGLRALGILGDATAVPMLVELLTAEGKLAQAARQALETIRGQGIDEKLIAIKQQEKNGTRRLEWIGLIEARRAAGAVPALLAEATAEDADVRSRAMAALAQLAGPKEVAVMIAAALKAEKGQQRDNAEKAVMLVCQQIADPAKRAEPLVDALRTAGAADKAALLPMLGRIGGPQALAAVQAALASDDAATYEAAVRAIANWPDPSVAAQLLKLSQTARGPNHRIWALRGFIRVIALPGKTPDAERLAMLKQAMPLATRDEERGLILERAAAVRTLATLQFVLPYLDEPALAEPACKAVVELAHHRELRVPYAKEFDPAMEKVLKTSRDATTIERAKRYLGKL